MNFKENIFICRRLPGFFKGSKTGLTGVRVVVERTNDSRVKPGQLLRLFDPAKKHKGSLRYESAGTLLAVLLTREDDQPLKELKGLYQGKDIRILSRKYGGLPDELMTEKELEVMQKTLEIQTNI